MRLIDADALIMNTLFNPKHVPRISRQDVQNAPTVEAEPVKCGAFYQDDDRDEWYRYPNHCVSCGQTWMGSTNYCPNCGIKLTEVIIMEGKDESGRCD